MTSSDDSAHVSPELTADACWQNAVAAIKRNSFGDAERWFRECLRVVPDHSSAMLNLGVLLAHRSEFEEALGLLSRAVKIKPTIDVVFTYAKTLLRVGKVNLAQARFKDILTSAPDHVPSLLELGQLSKDLGDRRSARNYYRQAYNIDNQDVVIAIRYAIESWKDDPSETASIFDYHFARTDLDASSRLKLLQGLIIYKEFHERIKRKLMPYHATNLEELFFTYADEEFAKFLELSKKMIEKDPEDISAQMTEFTAKFCSGDRPGAESVLKKFKTHITGHILETVTFDPAFYEMLEGFSDVDLLKNLPSVETILSPDFSEDPIAYLSCNFLYFENFAAPMIRSLADVNPSAQVHLHIMDAEPAQLNAATAFCQFLGPKIALTVEQPGVEKQGKAAARSYYHAIRFIRFYQHLLHYKRTLWLMDVDALFNRSPQSMYDVLQDKDAALRIRAGRLEPWNQFNACIVAGSASASSLEYFRLIAAYIAHFFQKDGLRWGIDQLAMYGVFEYMRDNGRAPDLAFLDDKAIDYEYLEDGIVWCNSGRSKFLHTQRNPDGSLAIDDPDRAAYIKLFDKYYAPLTT